MKKIYWIMLCAGAMSCASNSQKNEDTASSSAITAQSMKIDNVEITNTSDYSKAFIDELVAGKYEQPVKLTGDYIITGTDTFSFPAVLPLSKPTTFVADKDNKHYELEITRTNLSSVNFKFELTDNTKKVLHTEKGEASMSPFFFLGAESDEDENEEMYDVIPYTMNDAAGNCYFSLRVESAADANGKQKARVNYGCTDSSKPALEPGESPVLRAK